MGTSVETALAFLTTGGETGALMGAHDWSQSPLGAPASWPQSLRSVAGLLLHSKFPMFVAWGPELGFLYNDAYAAILGAKHPAALGRRFHEIWAEIWDDIQPIIKQAMQGHGTYHENLPLMVNRNGYEEQAWFTFSYSPVHDESGHVAGMFCAVVETTERVLAERHRTEEHERLQRLFQQAPGFIGVLRGPDHIFDIANDAYCRLVGHRSLVGKPVREALPELEGQGFFEQLDQVYATGKPFFGTELPARLQRQPNGLPEERFVSFIYQPTIDHRGNVTGIFVEGSDVTETVNTYRALRESENELKAANRRKDEFLAMLAHELRNPLAPIATAAELLKLAVLDEGRVRKTSEVIARQVGHMTELIDDLLDVSRVTRGLVQLQQETLDVGGLLADAVEQVHALMETKRQRFTIQVPDEPFFVRGDRTRLIQVFSNILNNAAKYTPEEKHISLRVVADEAHVEVAVEDNGIGIAPALLPHIFDLFTQAERSPDRSQGGLGLGLALVKSLLELQGGEVSAHSDGVNKGSTFIVRLPRVIAPASCPEPQPSKDETLHAAHKMRVAVVDDNKDAAQMLLLLLESAGHEVSAAYNAQDALAMAQRTSPEILFIDIGLPEMDGYELARRLRAIPETAGSMLVAVTGYGQPQDQDRSIESGFDHHLVKPVKMEDVLELITHAEHQGRPSA
jgi:signal transduction histidine kinase/ActR/RegA family two-component response regulator